MSALLDLALETIRTRRKEFEERFALRLIGVVGSVARGEERADSDIDVVFDVAGKPDLFDLFYAEQELGVALGRVIDLVNREAMRPKARAYIERDLVLA